LGAGGVDRRVPGDRARADRAAEGLAPEVRQGGGIGAVDGQGRETQADGGGHDGFPSNGLIHRRPRSVYGTSGSGASARTGPSPVRAGRFWWFPLVSGDASGEDSLAGNSGERPVVSCWTRARAGAGMRGFAPFGLTMVLVCGRPAAKSSQMAATPEIPSAAARLGSSPPGSGTVSASASGTRLAYAP